MKLKYIDINGQGVLVEETIPDKSYKGQYYLDGKLFHTDKVMLQTGCKAAICAEKELNLDLPILPNWRELEVEQFLEKEAEKWCLINGYNPNDYIHSNKTAEYTRVKNIFIVGYNNNKAKYTKKDLIDAFNAGRKGVGGAIKRRVYDWNNPYDYIQSLQKVPKYIVLESESVIADYEPQGCDFPDYIEVPKLLTNSDGKEEVIIKEIIY